MSTLCSQLSKTALNTKWMGLRVRPASAVQRPGYAEGLIASRPPKSVLRTMGEAGGAVQMLMARLLDRITGRAPGSMSSAAAAHAAGDAADHAAQLRQAAGMTGGFAFPGRPEVYVNRGLFEGMGRPERRAALKALLRHEGSHAWGAPESVARVLGDGPAELGRYSAEMAAVPELRRMYDASLLSLPALAGSLRGLAALHGPGPLRRAIDAFGARLAAGRGPAAGKPAGGDFGAEGFRRRMDSWLESFSGKMSDDLAGMKAAARGGEHSDLVAKLLGPPPAG